MSPSRAGTAGRSARFQRDFSREHDPQRRRCRRFEQLGAGRDRHGVRAVGEGQHVGRVHAREHRHALQRQDLFDRGQTLIRKRPEIGCGPR